MKSRQTTQIPALFLIIITALTVPSAGFAQPAGAVGQNTGLTYGAQPEMPLIDPTTGLPMAPQEKPWKDPDWKDPDKVLAEVNYDGLPISEVARHLRQEFKDAFDVIIPRQWQDPNNPSGSYIDPRSLSVSMQLKNVTASEVFNAMNIEFEGENSPCRWELRMNGNRPTAILRVLPQLLPPPQRVQPPPKRERTVFFVGDFIGDQSGGMTIEQLVKTLSEVYQMSGEGNARISYHKEAQLVIVSGTEDDIHFIERTLSAMRTKVRMDARAKPADSSPSGATTKPR